MANTDIPSWIKFCSDTAPMAAFVVFMAVRISSFVKRKERYSVMRIASGTMIVIDDHLTISFF